MTSYIQNLRYHHCAQYILIPSHNMYNEINLGRIRISLYTASPIQASCCQMQFIIHMSMCTTTPIIDMHPATWASAQSDQSLRCPHGESLGPWLRFECTAKTLIRLRGCPGGSLLGAQVILLVLSCDGSYMSDIVIEPVFGVCDQVILKLTCSATETSLGLEISAIARRSIILYR